MLSSERIPSADPVHKTGVLFLSLRVGALILVLGMGAVLGMRVYHASCLRKERRLRESMGRIHRALDQFKERCGRFPLTDEGLEALSRKPERTVCPGYPKQGFIPQSGLMLDPWGYRYLYTSHGPSFVLRSLGADGQPGGQGIDRDVSFPADTEVRAAARRSSH